MAWVIITKNGSFVAGPKTETDFASEAVSFERHEDCLHASFAHVGSRIIETKRCVEYNPESLRESVHFQDHIAQGEISSPRKLLGNLFAFGLGIAFWVLLGVTWLG